MAVGLLRLRREVWRAFEDLVENRLAHRSCGGGGVVCKRQIQCPILRGVAGVSLLDFQDPIDKLGLSTWPMPVAS